MNSFNLKSGNSEFNDRQRKVFDQLKVLEDNRKAVSSCNDVITIKKSVNNTLQKKETNSFRGKESIFKKPMKAAPKNYINRMPDFKKNPHKWTKYSLEDVQDVTEESNKKSAMEFLKELANRKKSDKQTTDHDIDKLPSKVVFNKHARKNTGTEETNLESSHTKVSFNSSKLIMPEYNIGQKPIKVNNTTKKEKPDRGKELKLAHLNFEDE